MTRPQVPTSLGLAGLALALVLAGAAAAGPIATAAGATREMTRAGAASALLARLRDHLGALPLPAPRCSAACLPGEAVAAAGAVEAVLRTAEAAAGLPGAGPAEREAAARLADVLRTALAQPAVLDPAAAEGLRLEAASLLGAVESGAERRGRLAGAVLSSVLPAALGWGAAAGLAALALGAMALAMAWRERVRRRRAEETQAPLLAAMEQVGDLVTIVDPGGRIAYVNKAVLDVTGYSRGELLGARSASWFPWYAGVPFLADLQRAIREGKRYRAGVLGRRKTGEAFLAEETATPLSGPGGEPRGVLSTAREVTEHRLLECTLQHRAHHDPLTGLPNRRHLARLMEQAIRPDAGGAGSAAVLALDLDRFTQLNDVLGSAAGDGILAEVAQRLRAVAGPRDLVARLGGDSFALVRMGEGGPVDAGAAAEAVRRAVARIRTGEQDLSITAAIGIALFPEHGRDARSLLDRAELALRSARLLGRGSVHYFDDRVAREAAELLHMEKRLAAALRDQEYQVDYQPYFDLATRRMAGVEALVTWRSAELGTVPASRFVPLLEESGMIVEVGRWVLETACRQAREWQLRGREVPVSVNLSGVQFHHQHLVETVFEAVQRHRLGPGLLTLEVTETACLEDLDFAAAALQRLKGAGVSISVDDFGTGYSSLSYLKRLPVDTIKIDISFVRDVSRDQDAASIVSAITTMARSLGLRTVAEGVETEEQRQVLHLLRCDMGQGFYFSPAVPPGEVEGFLPRPPASA